jgi:transposase
LITAYKILNNNLGRVTESELKIFKRDLQKNYSRYAKLQWANFNKRFASDKFAYGDGIHIAAISYLFGIDVKVYDAFNTNDEEPLQIHVFSPPKSNPLPIFTYLQTSWKELFPNISIGSNTVINFVVELAINKNHYQYINNVNNNNNNNNVNVNVNENENVNNNNVNNLFPFIINVQNENNVNDMKKQQQNIQKNIDEKLMMHINLMEEIKKEKNKLYLIKRKYENEIDKIEILNNNSIKKRKMLTATDRMRIGQKAFLSKDGQKEIAQDELVSQATVSVCKKEYLEDLDRKANNSNEVVMKIKKRTGPKKKINSETMLNIYEYLLDNPIAYLHEIVNHMETKHQMKLSIPTLWRELQSIGISYRNAIKLPKAWNSPDAIQQRMDYATNVPRQIIGKQEIAIDETHFNLTMARSKGRAVNYEYPLSPIPVYRGKSVSVICALTKKKMLYYHIVPSTDGSTKAEHFKAFLCNLSTMHHEDIQDSILLIDNHSTHTTAENKKILDQFQRTHRTTYTFLPPYSPFLNPIEYSFHHIKRYVISKRPQDMRSLIEAIKESMAALTEEQAKGCFQRAEMFRKWSEKGLSFNGTLLNPIADEDLQQHGHEL